MRQWSGVSETRGRTGLLDVRFRLKASSIDQARQIVNGIPVGASPTNTARSPLALGEFGISKEELRARNLLKPPPPDPAPRLIEQMQKAKCLFPANRIQMDGNAELIIIQGQLHFYRLFRSTGKIERVSDNKGLELNWAAIPDSLRVFLRREGDAPERLDYRAHMLMYDSIFSRYSTISYIYEASSSHLLGDIDSDLWAP